MQRTLPSAPCLCERGVLTLSSPSTRPPTPQRGGQSTSHPTYARLGPNIALETSGTSPIFTASRLEKFLIASHQSFPPIPPSSNAWVEMGVNARPTFFGCDPKLSPPEYPLVVYLPNAPPVNGDDPVTKFVLSLSSMSVAHVCLLVLSHSPSNTLRSTRRNSSIRHTSTRYQDMFQVPWAATRTGESAFNALPSIGIGINLSRS
jgi:hypothetical protein